MISNTHIVMVVTNPCVNDARVIKEAEALADNNFKVTVICRQLDNHFFLSYTKRLLCL